MTDKAVGELWREALHYQKFANIYEEEQEHARKTISLIRKLVEEHRKYNTLAHKDGSLSRTIHDFGISEEEWPG